MADLRTNLNTELYKTWEKEASNFWQAARHPESEEKSANCLKKLEKISYEQSQSFWEDLATQRS
ncbi:MAG: hypothetical protein ACFBSE_24765 [Prochloraceae cyanobacterium]